MQKVQELKINKYLFFTIIIAIISIFISRFHTIEELSINMKKNLFILGWIINLLFIWNIYSIYKMKKDILDFNIIFLTFIFLFCNGQIFLYTLGIPIKNLEVLRISTNEEIIKEAIYFYFSLLFFQIGSMLCSNNKKMQMEKLEDEYFIKSIKICAFIMLMISILPYLYILLPKVKLSIQYGYGSLYTNLVSNIGIMGYISKFFIPSLIIFLYIYKDKKINFYIIISLLLTIAIINLILGARGEALSIIVILLVFYNTFIKRFKGKKIINLIILILILMLIIPVVASFRSVKDKNIDLLINTIKENIMSSESNFVVKTISELGYTMNAFILTDKVVPDVVNYKYGESYLASILMLIPSQLMGGYSFASKAALDIWLQDIHKMPYGPGFSIVAETYYNFGYYGGIVFTLLIGIVFYKLLNMYSKDKNKNFLLRLLSLVFLYNSLIIARFPFHNTIRNIVYMYLVPYLVIIIIYNTIKRKGNKIS